MASSSFQSPSNFNILIFCITLNLFQLFNANIKKESCEKVLNLTFFCKYHPVCLVQGQKVTLESFKLWLRKVFRKDFSIQSQNRAMLKSLNYYYIQKMPMRTFQITPVLIFGQFIFFQQMSDLPQVIRDLISSIRDIAFELSQDLVPSLLQKTSFWPKQI